MLTNIREEISNNINRKVSVKIYGMRNRKESFEGYIKKAYNNIFIIEHDGLTRSFSYNEVITKDVVITYL